MASFTVGLSIVNKQLGAASGFDTNSITAAQVTAVAADVATLVADGATPTQAHVTTLNTDWGAIATANGTPAADVVLTVNATNVLTRTQLRNAVAVLLKYFEGNGALTP